MSKMDLGKQLANNLADVTLEKCAGIGLENARRNLPYCERSVLEMPEALDSFADNSAIVIAAGPSLHRMDAANKIKQSGYRGMLVATESAMSYCLRNDLVPDVVVTLDPHAKRIVRFFGDSKLTLEDLEDDDYFQRQDLDPEFARNQLKHNAELLALINEHGPKMQMAVATCASDAVVDRCQESGMGLFWWNPFYDDYGAANSLTRQVYELNGLPCINTGGNVGTACWVMAHSILGVEEVALVGVDLSYHPDTEYSQTQYYYELIELVGQDRLDEAFIEVENPHLGQTWYTDPTYYWYREAFLEMAADAPCTTYNCTEGGILFGDGIEFITLDKFIDDRRDRSAR